MSQNDMPVVVKDAILETGRSLPGSLAEDIGIDGSIVFTYKVADHADPDCDYAARIHFVWDLPGALVCYASTGIWNPPEPADGLMASRLIDVGPTDAESFHNIMLRAVAVPEDIASVAKRTIDKFIAELIPKLMIHNTPFSTASFDHGDSPGRLLAKSYTGLINHKGALKQWFEVLAAHNAPS